MLWSRAEGPLGAVAFFGIAAAAWLALSRNGRKMLGPHAVLDYEDPAEPTVRVLGIGAH